MDRNRHTGQGSEGDARDLEQSPLHFTGWATRSRRSRRPDHHRQRGGERPQAGMATGRISDPAAFHQARCLSSHPLRADTDRPALGTTRPRDFAKQEFANHQYAMVLHTFETDPDPNPARHPHVHLTVKTAGFDGTRLNPRKPDLQRWREGFAEALREHGIEATTTSRLHRTTHERWTVRHRVDDATHATQVDRRTRETRVPRVHREVMQNYERVMKALARSERGDDRQLAAGLVRHFTGRSLVAEKEKGRLQERE